MANTKVTSDNLDTNIDIAGTFDVTGATTLDAGATIVGSGTGAGLYLNGTNSDSIAQGNFVRYGTNFLTQSDAANDDLITYAFNGSTFVNALNIKSDGKIGIGTVSPTSKLHLEDSASNAIVQIGFENDAQEWRLGVHGGLSDGFILYDNTNSASRFFVGTNGNVGIGTTSPDSILDIEGVHSQLRLTDSDDSKFVLFSYSGGKLIVRNNDASTTDNIYALQEDGNFGIGTHSPSEKLHIATSSGDCTVLIEAEENSSSREPHLQLKGTNTSSNPIIEFGDSAGFPGTIEYENSDNSMRFGTNAGERIRINSSGNLGIGTTSPEQKLHVVGKIKVSDDIVMAQASPRIDYDNGSTGALRFYSTSTSSERMRISSNGSVGIGTTSTSTRTLNVAQLTASEQALYINSTSSNVASNAAQLYLQFSGDSSPDSGSRFVEFASQSAIMGSIKAASASTVQYNTSSDERLKDNIVDAEGQLETVLKTKVREYDWKNDGVHNVGFIAQELNEVIPDVVQQGGDDVNVDPWQIDYGKLTPYLVKAIQEQQALIEALQKEVEELKGG